jgi:hemerythrin
MVISSASSHFQTENDCMNEIDERSAQRSRVHSLLLARLLLDFVDLDFLT